MPRLFLVLLCVAFATGVVRAQSTPDDAYVQIYSLIEQGDTALANRDSAGALSQYTEAQKALLRLKNNSPTWNTNVVSFRLRYLAQRIERLQAEAPRPVVTSVSPAIVTSPTTRPGVGPTAPVPEDPQLARARFLEQQIQALQQDNQMLTAKLKEALSIQPPAVDVRELARAQDKLRDSTREIETLKAALDAEKARPAADNSQLEKLRQSLTDANRSLTAQAQAAESWSREKSLLQQRIEDLATDKEALAAMRAENEVLKKQAADLTAQGVAATEKVQELNRLLQQSQAQVTRLAADQEASRAEKRFLEQRVAELQAGQTNESARVAMLEADRAMLIRERDAARSQLTKAVTELTSLRTQLAQVPATVSNNSARAERDLRAMQVERDALDQRLAKAQSALLVAAARGSKPDTSTVQQLQSERDDLRKQLAAVQGELGSQRTRSAQDAENLRKLKNERDSAFQQKDGLQQQLETALADLKRERTKSTSTSTAERERLRSLEQERDFLKDQLTRALQSPTNNLATDGSERINALANQLAGLCARLDAYEAKAVPYTPEELALFQQPAPGVASFDLNATLTMRTPGTEAVAPPPRPSRVAPANARELIAEGQRAFAARRYDEAEQKYLEALKADYHSVFVLANLGAIELELNQLPAAEQHLQSAVALDAEDAFSLTVFGYLRYQQRRYDDALELLGRAAKADPKRADTQNYLGIALSQKGLRGPAEAALRRAITIEPAYGSAHQNLAVVYIAQKPPMVELARWHYEKALAAHQPRDPNLEKMLEANGAVVPK